MAATTSSYTEATRDLARLFARAANRRSAAPQVPDFLSVCFKHKYTLETGATDDAGDRRRLVLCPAGTFLKDFAITVPDLDTNVSPALVFDILLLDSANNEGATKIVSASTIGQAGGSAILAPAAKGLYVGGSFITWKTTTAAGTAAAGDITVWFELVYGIADDVLSNFPRVTSY